MNTDIENTGIEHTDIENTDVEATDIQQPDRAQPDLAHPDRAQVDAKGRPLAVVPTRVPWLEIGVFFVVAFVLAWLACLPLWLSGKGMSDPLLVQVTGMAMMFTPLIAAVVATIVQRKRAKEPLASIPRYFGIWPLRPFGRVLWTSLLAFFGVVVFIIVGYFLSAAFGWVKLDPIGLSGFKVQLDQLPGLESVPLAVAVIGYLVIMVISSLSTLIFAFGEEAGWRGWLTTSLRPLGTWPALIIVGVIWGLWHAPLILLGYNFNRPDITGLALMVVGCVMLGILFGWLRIRTGSVWPAVVAHGALNGSTGMLLGLFIDAKAPTPDMALVSGLGAAGWIVSALIIVALVATGQFRKRPELGIKRHQEKVATDAAATDAAATDSPSL